MITGDAHHPSVDWANAAGRDCFGLFADFEFGVATQRLRWIPPGRFYMGSPENEPRRWGNEGPRHKVVIDAGFWLFDTPCTQALWEAAMGDNPSWFKSPDRPVENVSFEEVTAFLTRINGLVPGLALVLPTEAQWEYAARAGTKEASHAGRVKFIGQNNAPALDAIAWYGGNSGDIELVNAWNSSLWLEKQYPHERAGTHPVGLKAPNAWGLYDMLGNVWEWCADAWRPDYEQAPHEASDTAAQRATRGGSWFYDARNVRAASRWYEPPGYRSPGLGFRCARPAS